MTHTDLSERVALLALRGLRAGLLADALGHHAAAGGALPRDEKDR